MEILVGKITHTAWNRQNTPLLSKHVSYLDVMYTILIPLFHKKNKKKVHFQKKLQKENISNDTMIRHVYKRNIWKYSPFQVPVSTLVNWTGQPKKKRILQLKSPSHLEIASNYLSFTKLHSVLEFLLELNCGLKWWKVSGEVVERKKYLWVSQDIWQNRWLSNCRI